MNEAPAPAAEVASDEDLDAIALPADVRQRHLVEVIAVLLLAVVPPLAQSVVGTQVTYRTTGDWAIPLLVRSLQVSAPVLLLVRRSGEPWGNWGFKRFHPRLDIACFLGITVARFIALSLANVLLSVLHVSQNVAFQKHTEPHGVEWGLFGLALLANGFAEEFVMRAYLIRRLVQLRVSEVGAVLITSLLFGAYHLYYGVSGAVMVGLGGVVLGSIYLQTKRLWPLVAWHAAYDVYAMMAYWAYARGGGV